MTGKPKKKGKKDLTTYPFTYNTDNTTYKFTGNVPEDIFVVSKEYTFFQFLRRLIILTMPPYDFKFLMEQRNK